MALHGQVRGQHPPPPPRGPGVIVCCGALQVLEAGPRGPAATPVVVKQLEATSDGHGSASRFERMYSEVAALEMLQVGGGAGGGAGEGRGPRRGGGGGARGGWDSARRGGSWCHGGCAAHSPAPRHRAPAPPAGCARHLPPAGARPGAARPRGQRARQLQRRRRRGRQRRRRHLPAGAGALQLHAGGLARGRVAPRRQCRRRRCPPGHAGGVPGCLQPGGGGRDAAGVGAQGLGAGPLARPGSLQAAKPGAANRRGMPAPWPLLPCPPCLPRAPPGRGGSEAGCCLNPGPRPHAQVVDAVAVMHAHHIAHFDLKCSNVLLESLPGQAGSGLGQLAPGAQQAPFRAVLGDFGQAAILAGRWVGWGLWWVPPWPPGPVGHC